MPEFTIIERGILDTGESYYVSRRFDGWTRCFLGPYMKRRSMDWLREQPHTVLEQE